MPRLLATDLFAATSLSLALGSLLGACSGKSSSLIADLPAVADGKGGTFSAGGSSGNPSFEFGEEAGKASSGGEAGDCGAIKLAAEPKAVNILLVIDKSSSMKDESGFSKSKWLALRDGLSSALARTKDRISYGMSLFPFNSDPNVEPSTCETPTREDPLVPIGQGTVPEILSALERYSPAGGTPTAAALASGARRRPRSTS